MIAGADLVRMLADPASGLVITPIIDAPSQIGSASIDIRLGPDIIVSRRATGVTSFDASDAQAFEEALRRRQAYVRRGIGEPFHLQPGEFAIARSLEYVQLPEHVSAEALGRSSWGRLGLTIATATLIDPGFRGTITLELANVGNTPMVLGVGLRVAQLSFSRDGAAVRGSPGWPRLRHVHERRQIRRAEHWWANSQRRRRKSRYESQMRPELSKLHRDEDMLWVSPMALKYVVGVVGHRFAGKSTVVNFLVSRRGFRVYRLATFVYEEAARRGMDIADHAKLREVGNDMRERWGPDILARMAFARIRSHYLDADRRREPAPVVVEGFKLPEELAAWQQLAFYRTLRLDVPPLERLDRALRAGAIPADDAGGVPPKNRSLERGEWLRRHIDEPDDGRHHAQPVVDEAERCSVTYPLDNGRRGLEAFEEDLKKRVRELEIWSRSLEH